MKKTKLFVSLLFVTTFAVAQDLPQNPEPGKCYVRCTTPDVYVNETVQVMVKPSYKILKIIPAVYEKVTERVLVKEESKKLVIVPAKWGTKTESYVKKQGASSLGVVPATFSNDSETVEIKPAYSQWELGAKAPDCESGNPDDCRYWCYKSYPAEYVTVPVTRLANEASTSKSSIAEEPGTYTKKVIIEPAKVVEEVIPAEYTNITKTIMVKDAQIIEEVIPAEYKMVTKEVLKTKGGLTDWKAVECALVEYQALPINWNLGSASLTAEAKQLIDTRLLPVLAQNPGIKLEIASHTDSRGTKESNQDLSERRAKTVVQYLQTKGINPSLLVANGYGETRLKNRCADGVSCTEREHAVNRRTEFRLIN